MKRHLFFDLDRTLWDFEKNSQAALSILYHDLKLDDHIDSFHSFHGTYKRINAKLWQLYGSGQLSKEVLRIKRFTDTLERFAVKNDELSNALADGYVKISPYQTNLFPGTKETLEILSEDNQLHIITNGFKEIQFIKLENSGIRDFFDVIVCSELVGKNKPAPDVFHYALKEANARVSESVMIGDDYHVDVLGAENIGVPGILFEPNTRAQKKHRWQIETLHEIPDLLPHVYFKEA